MEFIEPTSSTVLARGGFRPVMPAMPQPGQLSILALKTPAERLLIAPLRKYADFTSEYELDPGMAALEQKKDGLGIVMAIFQDGLPIATIRFIPGGHGVTLTERFWGRFTAGTDILGPNNWEVGRLVMAPEHRRADLLPKCMSLALMELLEHADVEQFHASCLTRMTRLYRRFGFTTIGTRAAASGWEAALIHGDVDTVARALKVPMQSEAAVPVLQ